MITMTLRNRNTGEPIGTSGDKGLECPRCGCCHFYVNYTRPKEKCIMRSKSCRNCGFRVITHEKVKFRG